MRKNWWLEMTRDLTLLSAECAEVMARRSLVLAKADGAAWAEFQLMVSEKVAAALELQARVLTGTLGSSKEAAARAALSHVRRKVRANRRRLRK
jgi:hypothetical protein